MSLPDKTTLQGLAYDLLGAPFVWIEAKSLSTANFAYDLLGAPFAATPFTSSSNTTVALTGVSATGSIGSFTVAAASTVALTGVAAVSSVGSLAGAVTIALTGVAAAGSSGLLGAGITVGLSGVSGAGSAGSLTGVPSTLLEGVSATGAIGDFTVTATGTTTGSLDGVSAGNGVPFVHRNERVAVAVARVEEEILAVQRGMEVLIAPAQAVIQAVQLDNAVLPLSKVDGTYLTPFCATLRLVKVSPEVLHETRAARVELLDRDLQDFALLLEAA